MAQEKHTLTVIYAKRDIIISRFLKIVYEMSHFGVLSMCRILVFYAINYMQQL